MEKLNLALLTKLAWRVCTKEGQLWVQIFGSKYFKYENILHQNIEAKNCSYMWNGITKGLKIIQDNYFMEINNGRKTRIWKDRWVPSLNHPPIPMYDMHRFYETVDELIISDSATWNIPLLDSLFDTITSKKIQDIFIDNSKEDIMIWTPAKDGKFTVKSAYNHLARSTNDTQVNGSLVQPEVWKALWSCSVAHRIKLFSWKCLHECHPTRYKLAVHNPDMETQCGICGREEETIEHLLFDCRHARAVWRNVNIDIDAVKTNCGSLSDWVLSWFNGCNSALNEQLLFTCMIGACIIWKDRCEKIFQGVNLNPISSAHRIQYHLSSHLHENLNSSPYCVDDNKSNWCSPVQGIAKFNVDTSFDHNTNQNGTGVVLRDYTGNCDGIRGSFNYGVLNPEQGECLAAREALSWAKEMKLDDIQIEADAQVVIKAITEDPWLVHWENKNLITEIKHPSSFFNSCNFTFVGREDNQVDKSIAKNVRALVVDTHKFDNFGKDICDLLAQDQNNISG
ncbi:uncharacterized protein LOC113279300 [Papaver somniferum]|uniref:uncharacterized protein LOC113279300 n=1 Tax=Papaver somniferum TaxID=3469 RepID=UPI000E6FDB3E|nr:uncharacterized protein LOC113279300 [Papaver somniferum]